MLATSHCKSACTLRAHVVAYAQKGSSRRTSRGRGSNQPASEVQQLLSEYQAVKQTTPSSITTGRSSTAPRSLPTPPEASAATKHRKKGFGRTAPKPRPTPPGKAPPASAGRSAAAVATPLSSKAGGTASPVAAAAAAQQPPPPTAAGDGTTTTAQGTGPLPSPMPPLKVAGTRHEAFESKLTKPKQDDATSSSNSIVAAPKAAAAAAAPPAPTAQPAEQQQQRAASPSAGRALLEDSLARLSTANEDVAAAEEHMTGLTQLLQDARSMLASLRADAAAAAGPAAAANSEAEHLVGIMTDLLADLSGELELVREHLTSTRADISSTHSQLEAAAAGATPDLAAVAPAATAPPQPTAAAAAAAAAEAIAAAERKAAEAVAAVQKKAAAAAMAAAAAEARAAEAVTKLEQQAAAAAVAATTADEKVAAAKSQLDLKEAELSLLLQQNEQLQNQLTLTQQQVDAAAAAAAAAATAAPPSSPAAAGSNGLDAATSARLREVLLTQVQCNMTLLDKLGVLAQTVVGLPGLQPADRVKLASTISQCVLAVGAVALPEDLLAASEGSSK